jgi:hypothetical protein
VAPDGVELALGGPAGAGLRSSPGVPGGTGAPSRRIVTDAAHATDRWARCSRARTDRQSSTIPPETGPKRARGLARSVSTVQGGCQSGSRRWTQQPAPGGSHVSHACHRPRSDPRIRNGTARYPTAAATPARPWLRMRSVCSLAPRGATWPSRAPRRRRDLKVANDSIAMYRHSTPPRLEGHGAAVPPVQRQARCVAARAASDRRSRPRRRARLRGRHHTGTPPLGTRASWVPAPAVGHM